MHTAPAVILSLYTRNTRPYTIGSRSTTVREFLADALLQTEPVAFEPQPHGPTPQFQVDTQLK